jgi:hypothetical protein
MLSAQQGTDGVRVLLQTSFYRIIDRFIDQGGADTDSVFGGAFKDDPGVPVTATLSETSEEKLTRLRAVHCVSITAVVGSSVRLSLLRCIRRRRTEIEA